MTYTCDIDSQENSSEISTTTPHGPAPVSIPEEISEQITRFLATYVHVPYRQHFMVEYAYRNAERATTCLVQ